MVDNNCYYCYKMLSTWLSHLGSDFLLSGVEVKKNQCVLSHFGLKKKSKVFDSCLTLKVGKGWAVMVIIIDLNYF